MQRLPGRQARAVAPATALPGFHGEAAEGDEGVGQRGEDQQQHRQQEQAGEFVEAGFQTIHERFSIGRRLTTDCRTAPAANSASSTAAASRSQGCGSPDGGGATSSRTRPLTVSPAPDAAAPCLRRGLAETAGHPFDEFTGGRRADLAGAGGRQLPPALGQFAAGLLAGVPVALADGLGHARDDLRLGGRIVRFEPLGETQLAAVHDEGIVQRLPLVGADHGAIRRLPAPQVVGQVEHFQAAGVALALHRGDPLRAEVAPAQLAGEELRGGRGARLALAQVGDVQRRAGAVEVAYRQRQAAEVLERVVGGEHAVERRGAREDRRLYTLQLFGEQVAAIQLHAPVATAVGVLQAPEELLGERRVVVPAGGVEGQLRYPVP